MWYVIFLVVQIMIFVYSLKNGVQTIKIEGLNACVCDETSMVQLLVIETGRLTTRHLF